METGRLHGNPHGLRDPVVLLRNRRLGVRIPEGIRFQPVQRAERRPNPRQLQRIRRQRMEAGDLDLSVYGRIGGNRSVRSRKRDRTLYENPDADAVRTAARHGRQLADPRRRAGRHRIPAEARLFENHRHDRLTGARTVVFLDEPRHGRDDHLRIVPTQK